MKISLSTTIKNNQKSYDIFVPVDADLSDIYTTVKNCYKGDIKSLVQSDIEFIYCSILIKVYNLPLRLYTQKRKRDERLKFVEPHYVESPQDIIRGQQYAFKSDFLTTDEMSDDEQLALYHYLKDKYSDIIISLDRNSVITTGFKEIINSINQLIKEIK